MKISIDGKSFTLVGEETEEHMRQVAEYIDQKMTEIRQKAVAVTLDSSLAYVLTSINVADDYFKEKAYTAETATKTYNKQQYKQIIGNEFAILRTSEKAKGKTTRELFEMLEEQMNIKELTWIPLSSKAYIEVNNEYMLALYEDGSIKEEEIKVLDISNGSIDLKSNGYIQGQWTVQGSGYGTKYTVSGEFVENVGAYIITGTSTKNFVRVLEAGTYDIIINDLNIDVSDKGYTCAFNANRNKKASGVNVNLHIEGDNVLRSGASSAGLGFAGALPNLNGETSGSVLTMQGNGNLYVEGGHYSAAIGSGYTGPDSAQGDANNIIINSGNITAKSGSSYAAAIGGGLRKNANNIVINGGNINAICTSHGVGIGATGSSGNGIAKGIVINGGFLVVEGRDEGAIGGEQGSEAVQINGGKLTLKNTGKLSVLGDNCSSVILAGGTIIANSAKGSGIGTVDLTKNINITRKKEHQNGKG